MPYYLSDAHTSADIGLVASGADLRELFADAAVGLTSIMVDVEDLREDRIVEVDLGGEDMEILFYRWLSEIIYLKDAENFLLKRCQIDCRAVTPFRVSGRLLGDTIDPARQRLKTDVKAVTFYKMRVEKIENIWRGEVVLDL